MKRIAAVFAALLLLLTLGAGALAAPEGEISDPAEGGVYTIGPSGGEFAGDDFLWDDDYYLEDDDFFELEEYARQVSKANGCGVYVILSNSLSRYGYDDIEEFCVDAYEQMELGCGADKDGVLLTVDWSAGRYYIAPRGVYAKAAFTISALSAVEEAILPDLHGKDSAAAVRSFIEACESVLTEAGRESGTGEEAGVIHGATGGEFSTDVFVWDWGDYLDEYEYNDLADYADEISRAYRCGVYAAIVEDMEEYGYRNIEEFAEDFYEQMDLGCGDEKDGILLILSMAGRDFDLDAFGSFGNYAFTDYGKEVLESRFLDDFRGNDWYNGIGHYLQGCEELLRKARDGTPVDIWIPDAPEIEPLDPAARARRSWTLAGGVSGVLGAVSAFFFTGVQKSKMKTARTATEAGNYVRADGVQLTEKQDRFLYSTVARQRIQSSSSGRSGGGGHYGGTTVHSSGHSHHSGKF